MSEHPTQTNSSSIKLQTNTEEKIVLPLTSENIEAFLSGKKTKEDPNPTGENAEVGQEDPKKGEQLNTQIKKRKEYSKYDFIKVRVTLGEHFYVLSRFLVSRMLTLCKIPHLDAVKIAKDLKKHLVEANRLEIPQEEVNDTLFEFMRIYNYKEQYINRYKMISKFYQKRTPMIILISGTVGIAKSIIATHLAERMNISNVLQTDIVESVMTKMYPELFKDNLKTKEYKSEDELLDDYYKRCKLVRRGTNTDMHKCLVEGKPLIIEGFTLDPSLYIKRVVVDGEEQFKNDDQITLERQREIEDVIEEKTSSKTKEEKFSKCNVHSHSKDKLRVISYQASATESITDREKTLQKELEKLDQKSAVIVPILLVLNKRDHFYCVENKIDSLKAFDSLSYREKKVKINGCLDNYQTIQKHLIKKASLCTIVPISINNLEETLEQLQDIIIEKIEADYENWSL